MKRLVFTVTNDLNYDQRMQRICCTLQEHGFEVTLVGRKRNHSRSLQTRPFRQLRLHCFFDKGKLFYLEYNFRLLLFLLTHRFDVVCAIDLDTAIPVIISARLSSKPWVFDAHEYFSEMEEIVTRPLIHRVWKSIEQYVMKRATYAYTISDGYARMFREDYGKSFKVVKNVPLLRDAIKTEVYKDRLIYQGALNQGRGLVEALKALKSVPSLQLDVYGEGPLMPDLKLIIRELEVNATLHGAIEPSDLRILTPQAWCGLTLFSSTGRHHKHSLANRFFDYIHAGIPQIAMDYPEYRQFNDKYEVAILIKTLTPESIVDAIEQLQRDEDFYEKLRRNCQIARLEVNWQNEENTIIDLYNSIG